MGHQNLLKTEMSQNLSTAGGLKVQLGDSQNSTLLTDENKLISTQTIITEEKMSSYSNFENEKQGTKLNVILTRYAHLSLIHI